MIHEKLSNRNWKDRFAVLYFLGVQPLLFFLIPLVSYDELRLPALHTGLLLGISAVAWWGLALTLFGLRAGSKLLRGDSDAYLWINRYLLIALVGSVGILAIPFVHPVQFFARKELRLELAGTFIKAAILYGVWLLYSRLVGYRHQKNAMTRSAASFQQWSPRLRTALATIATIVGLFLSRAAWNTAPLDIFEAAWAGDATTLRHFLHDGIDVNSTTIRGNTPLHLARSKDVADFLLATSSRIQESYIISTADLLDVRGILRELHRGSSPVLQDLRNRLPLDFWAKAANRQTPIEFFVPDVTRILNDFVFSGEPWTAHGLTGPTIISHRTLDLRDKINSTIDAIRFNRLLLEDALPALLGKAGIDLRNDLGETPLHLAAFDARLIVCSTLIDHGASVNPVNKGGVTPLDYAFFGKAKGRKGDFDAVITLLRNKGGQAALAALADRPDETPSHQQLLAGNLRNK